MSERSQDWLAQAERDLEVAEVMLTQGFYEWVCFICQQAAEKAVKAIFQAIHGEAWGHSVSRLLKKLPEKQPPTEKLIKAAIRLDKFYIPPRYPNGFDSGAPKDYFTLEDAHGAVADATEIVKYCKREISG